tara:strand:- start:3248 stop:3457 length:210 start_codon:yes stop_codon:yes gene_type:complete
MNNNNSNEKKKAAAAAGAGAISGAIASSTIGGMGLAVGGTALSVGLAPVAVVGGIMGLAGYGIYRAFKK